MAPAPEGPSKKQAHPEAKQPEDASATQKFRTTAPAPKKQARETDLAGWRIGDFHLLRRLGGGGMAEVYLAEQLSLKRPVAFKVLRSELAADEKYIRRFQREAEAAAKINHANIVQIYAVGQHNGIHYIAQEYVQGQNLKELLNRHGALPWPRAVEIFRQAAAALGRAAKAGIVHRDVKPENILLTRDGEVKVADFGLARQFGGDKPLNLTQEGVTMGTPLYMSPEQVEGKALDDRSDLYSLGVTVYHMLTGAPPFRGESALGVAVQHVKGQARPLKEVRPDLPDDLCYIVHKLLAKDPGQRYQSAADLLDALSRVGSAEKPAPAPAKRARSRDVAKKERRPAPIPRTGRWSRARLRWAFALSLIVALGAGALAGWLRREPDLFAEAAARQPDVPKERSARAQWAAANIRIDDEAAWKAVIDYFGDDPSAQLYVNRAKQALAYLYLVEDRWDEALQLFDELAELPDSEAEFHATGLAGQAVVLSFQGRYEASNLRLARAFEYRNRLDRRMLELVYTVLRRTRQQADQRWRDFLEQELSDDAETSEEAQEPLDGVNEQS